MELCLQVTWIRGSTTVTCPEPAPSQSFIQTLHGSPTRCRLIVTMRQKRTQVPGVKSLARLWVIEQLRLTWSPDLRSLLFCNIHVCVQSSTHSVSLFMYDNKCAHIQTCVCIGHLGAGTQRPGFEPDAWLAALGGSTDLRVSPCQAPHYLEQRSTVNQGLKLQDPGPWAAQQP